MDYILVPGSQQRDALREAFTTLYALSCLKDGMFTPIASMASRSKELLIEAFPEAERWQEALKSR